MGMKLKTLWVPEEDWKKVQELGYSPSAIARVAFRDFIKEKEELEKLKRESLEKLRNANMERLQKELAQEMKP